MTVKSLARWLFSLFLSLPIQVSASTFTVHDRAPLPLSLIFSGECSISMQGEVEKGDALNLERIRGELEGPIYTTGVLPREPWTDDDVGYSICLDSGGGSFVEALELIDVAAGFVTIVRANERCLSACALFFMGGSLVSTNSDGGATSPTRLLSTGGLLGFHSPSLPNIRSARNLPFEAVQTAYRASLSTIVDIRRRLSPEKRDGITVFHEALFQQMLLHTGKEDFHYIRNIDQASLYGITLIDLPEVKLDTGAYARLCTNAVRWQHGSLRTIFDPDLDSWNYEVIVENKSGSELFYSQSRHYDCSIDQADQSLDVVYKFIEFDSVENRGGFRYWQSLPHYFRLLDLYDAYRQDSPVDSYEYSSRSTSFFPPITRYEPRNIISARAYFFEEQWPDLPDDPIADSAELRWGMYLSSDGNATVIKPLNSSIYTALIRRVRYSILSNKETVCLHHSDGDQCLQIEYVDGNMSSVIDLRSLKMSYFRFSSGGMQYIDDAFSGCIARSPTKEVNKCILD